MCAHVQVSHVLNNPFTFIKETNTSFKINHAELKIDVTCTGLRMFYSDLSDLRQIGSSFELRFDIFTILVKKN